VTDDVPPPEPLTAAEAAKLVAWLNFAAKKWPRVVGTLVMNRIPVDPREFADPAVDAWSPAPYRLPNLYGVGRGEFTVGLAELLAAALPPEVELDTRVSPAGTTFVTRGL
jgi:hypothetical protein